MSDEPRMTGMDREIFNATRTLTSLLNDACNHWNYLCPYLEKLAGVADDALRGYQKDYPEQVAELIDYRRERDSQGNAAAMREALENSNGLLEELAAIGEWGESAREQIAENNAALSAPPRQCDVGTAEEQSDRFANLCDSHIGCSQCPVKSLWNFANGHKPSCGVLWAQMPYEAEEGEGK